MAPHVHSHPVDADADGRRLGVALALILGFMTVEVVAGLLASSLALLSDAAHMLSDAAALGLALVALRLAARPPSGAMTFGLKRLEPLSALINGVALAVLGTVFAVGGVARLASPSNVDGVVVLVTAAAGIPVNLAAARVLAGARRRSINVEGAFAHVVTDLYAFILTAIAGAVIVITGFDRADALAALAVAALMLWAALGLLRRSGRIFMEASPRSIDPNEVGRALAGEHGVVEVHDLHVWELTSGFPSLSAHVVVGADADCHGVRSQLEAMLVKRFEISHSTLQVEHEHTELLTIE
jgi:cobalt-zinc-cadmium efflux system protein